MHKSAFPNTPGGVDRLDHLVSLAAPQRPVRAVVLRSDNELVGVIDADHG